jgi:sugar O-acyltransferase (sialic acid O-acetyltransferase NeuD family)
MMKKVVIIGAGGFGREVIEIFKDQNCIKKTWEILGFIDENSALWGKTINNFSVLGGLDWFDNNEGVGCVVAIGDPKTKKRITDILEAKDVVFSNAIHPSVLISEFVDLGKNVIICAGSILTVNISIKNHVIINLNCTVGHDTIIEDYCSIMPGVSINGENHIEKGVYIGTGTTFVQQIHVGEWSVIGAGAVVIDNIPNGVLAVGIPAKIKKRFDI